MHFWAKFRGPNGLKFNFLDPRGYFRFQAMDMIARGQKSKPKTFAGPKINAHHVKFLNLKNSHEKEKQVLLYICTLFAEICGWHTWAVLPRVLKNIMSQERVLLK